MPAKPPQPAVRVAVGAIELVDFTDYQIESDMFTPADAFYVKVANPNGRYAGLIKPGETCRVTIDGTLQMSGYVDEVRYTTDPGGAYLELQGRDVFQFLVDCSAPLQRLVNVDLLTLAQKLGSPWIGNWKMSGIEDLRKKLKKAAARVKRVKSDLNPNTPFGNTDREQLRAFFTGDEKAVSAVEAELSKRQAAREPFVSFFEDGKSLAAAEANLAKLKADLLYSVKVEPGETPWDILSRAAAKAHQLIWCAADGTGIIAKPNYAQKPIYTLSNLTREEKLTPTNNVLSLQVTESWAERYSTITVYGGAGNTKANYGPSSRHRSQAKDTDMPESVLAQRPLVLFQGNVQKLKHAQKVAEREVQQRKFRGLTIEAKVRGHENSGHLWQVDTLCNLDDAPSGQQGTFYVTRRRFALGSEGRTTELTLRKPGVFYP